MAQSEVRVITVFEYFTTVEGEDFSHIEKNVAEMLNELRVWSHDPEMDVLEVAVYSDIEEIHVINGSELPEAVR